MTQASTKKRMVDSSSTCNVVTNNSNKELRIMSLYSDLASSDRFVIYFLRRAGLTLAEIALQNGVHKSTVSREIRRNSGRRGYRP